MTVQTKPTPPKPKFTPPAGDITKKKMKCIPIELYEKIKNQHPEYFL